MQKEPPKGSLHTITVTNEQTGEIEIQVTGCGGGIFITHEEADATPMGTSQAVFGETTSIVVCALKIRPIVRQMMKQNPELGALLEKAERLMQAAGIFETI